MGPRLAPFAHAHTQQSKKEDRFTHQRSKKSVATRGVLLDLLSITLKKNSQLYSYWSEEWLFFLFK